MDFNYIYNSNPIKFYMQKNLTYKNWNYKYIIVFINQNISLQPLGHTDNFLSISCFACIQIYETSTANCHGFEFCITYSAN